MIKVIEKDGQLEVYTPYTPSMPKKARKTGGKWDRGKKAWIFQKEDEQHVRDMLISVYGTDGTDADLVDVLVTFTGYYSVWHDAICLYGRQICAAKGRDSGVRFGEGIIVKEDSFDSGGSVKNWRTCADIDAQVVIKGVPRKVVEEDPQPQDEVEVEIIGSKIDIEALRAEREKLADRILHIDEQLAEAG